MKNLNFLEIKEGSLKVRKQYLELERLDCDNQWTVEEGALAFLTDAGLVGRYTMSLQRRCPKENTTPEKK